MIRINYDEFKKEVIKRKSGLPMVEEGRLIRRKPREPQELQLLIKHALLRKEQAIKSGEFEILSPRRWRINAVGHTNTTPE